ncbi:MAG: hydroxymethylbilane synthase [Verrucomicrobia bacterium]|nr:hydroxymethylbilane synthase [Verrucomicrobiota bacterium]
MKVLAGARSSPLSRAQAAEVQKLLPFELEFIYVETLGDKDKKTSLRTLEKTDFFTRELDEMLLEKKIRLAVHSAKDLPDPIPEGLSIAAITPGLDARDSLVFRPPMPARPRIATSSVRREETVRALFPDAIFSDLRGTISERLSLLEQGEVDGLVIAEAALIRLNLTHLHRIHLPGETHPLQGKLALLIHADDDEMRLNIWRVGCKIPGLGKTAILSQFARAAQPPEPRRRGHT